MKKIILIIPLILLLCSCGTPEEVERKIIDARYTDSYIGIETTFDYELDLFSSTDTLHKMPNTHSVVYPKKYEIQYRIMYNDGSSKTVWTEVDRDVYENALVELGDVE